MRAAVLREYDAIDMNAVCMKNLAPCGTRGMPSWRDPSPLARVEHELVDVSPLIAREIPLTGASTGRRAFNGPITDFAN